MATAPSCIPYVQWTAANAACNQRTSTLSVKGFGYVPAGIRGIRGIGDLSFSITPASVATAIQSGQIVQTAPSAASTPPVVSTAPSINTTPVYDPTDPCSVASVTPCPAGTGCPADCPSGFHSINLFTAPGQPAQCVCGKNKPAVAPPSAPNIPVTATGPSSSASSTAGFSKVGILAVVAVLGFAAYKVATHKSS